MSKLISGIWYFNEVLTLSTWLFSQSVNFISNGSQYYKMRIEDDLNRPMVFFLTSTNDYECPYEEDKWGDEAYRTVDFGSTSQSVSDNFYDWLTANATKSGLNNLKTVTESIKKYVDSKDTDIKESVNSKAAAGAQLIDTSIAHTKDVPSDSAKYAGINKIGGMTRKCANLIPYPYKDTTKTVNGITFTDNGDGSVTVNGTSTNVAAFVFSTDKTLFKAGQVYTINGAVGDIVVDVLFSGVAWGGGGTFTVTEAMMNASKMDIEIRIATGITVSNVRIYPMLNKGSTALPYELYYEGLRDAKVTEIESVGANLLPYPYFNTTKTTNGITFTDNGDGSITVNGTPTSDAYFTLANGFNAVNGVTYKLSGKVEGTSIIFTYVANDGSKSYESSITKDEEHTISDIRFHIKVGNTFNNVVLYPMLNKGIEALPYTPYMESTLPIPEAVQALDGYGWGINADCYNYIDWESKTFVKRVEKVVFDGTEIWYPTTSPVLGKYAYAYKLNRKALCTSSRPVGIGISNIYPFNDVGGDVKNTFRFTTNNGVDVWFYPTEFFTVDEWKSYLAELYAAGNPLTIVYAPAEPVITDISDLLPDDNFIEVEGNGSITAVNEYGYDVPSEIVFNIKNNEQVNANTFVGDLIGKAQSAERDGAGRLLEDTYMSYSYDKVYTGETAAVSEFYAGETTYVSGVWKFNETIEMEEVEYTQAINYRVNGLEDNFKYLLYLADSNKMILCFTALNESSTDIYYDGWADEAYRTVDFGEKDQLTSPEFYTWLCANARRVEA